MTHLCSFNKNDLLTFGIELELQLVDLEKFDLAMEADDFLRRLYKNKLPCEVKPEITKSMIELNSSIHKTYQSLISEMLQIRNIISLEAEKTHIGVCGGGSHPFQKWHEQRISETERFSNISEQYGYLAKKFTIFGQHIHIACPNGDDALYLCHAMARYIPHFIALSASSPFYQGIDTAFDCSRLGIISAFPLSGTPPWIQTWSHFEDYFDRMEKLNLVKSMKDFYWDIRPKPEFGTIELRICDTPLTVEKASRLAVYMKLLVIWLLENRPAISKDIYLTYLINRFRSSRYGLEAIIVDPIEKTHIPILDDIKHTCASLKSVALRYESEETFHEVEMLCLNPENDAHWMKSQYKTSQSLNDVVANQVKIWSGLSHEE